MVHNATQKKVLILSGSLGDGHLQAAYAIRETLQQSQTETITDIIDFMELTHPFLHSFGRFIYLQGIKKFPSVYGYFFQKTRSPGTSAQMLKKLKLFGLSRIVRLLQEMQPDVVVCTFPIAALAMSIVKESNLSRIPTFTVITDYTDHSYWIHPYTDNYLVGSETVQRALERSGVPKTRITVTGIPVRADFCIPYNREGLQYKHNLDPMIPTILIMGGGCGLFGEDLTELLSNIALTATFQFIIVCGRNEKLRRQLSDELRGSSHRVIITGYTQHVHEYMVVSDLLISKPGGVTTSEAIALELPMLLYETLPGQEQDNAIFLQNAGVAVLAEDKVGLLQKLQALLHDPRRLNEMKRNAARFPTKQAARFAAETILHTENTYISRDHSSFFPTSADVQKNNEAIV